VTPFPWEEVMAAGLGILRLAPRIFWEMTPRELDAALKGEHCGRHNAARSLPRRAFAQSLTQIPS
jgi:uncharacterized phage protein (TIGR02216 family)